MSVRSVSFAMKGISYLQAKLCRMHGMLLEAAMLLSACPSTNHCSIYVDVYLGLKAAVFDLYTRCRNLL